MATDRSKRTVVRGCRKLERKRTSRKKASGDGDAGDHPLVSLLRRTLTLWTFFRCVGEIFVPRAGGRSRHCRPPSRFYAAGDALRPPFLPSVLEKQEKKGAAADGYPSYLVRFKGFFSVSEMLLRDGVGKGCASQAGRRSVGSSVAAPIDIDGEQELLTKMETEMDREIEALKDAVLSRAAKPNGFSSVAEKLPHRRGSEGAAARPPQLPEGGDRSTQTKGRFPAGSSPEYPIDVDAEEELRRKKEMERDREIKKLKAEIAAMEAEIKKLEAAPAELP